MHTSDIALLHWSEKISLSQEHLSLYDACIFSVWVAYSLCLKTKLTLKKLLSQHNKSYLDNFNC